MKSQLLLLSSICFILSSCEMNEPSGPGSEKTPSSPQERVENEADREITRKIRQALMDDDSLSINAKNIKIITMNGVVTLRGTVNSAREKTEIEKNARSVNGVKNVDNQIEIATEKSAQTTQSAKQAQS